MGMGGNGNVACHSRTSIECPHPGLEYQANLLSLPVLASAGSGKAKAGMVHSVSG